MKHAIHILFISTFLLSLGALPAGQDESNSGLQTELETELTPDLKHKQIMERNVVDVFTREVNKYPKIGSRSSRIKRNIGHIGPAFGHPVEKYLVAKKLLAGVFGKYLILRKVLETANVKRRNPYHIFGPDVNYNSSERSYSKFSCLVGLLMVLMNLVN